MNDNIKTAVKKRLEGFGCKVKKADEWLIEYSIEKVENYIKNRCNVGDIPDELKENEVDRVCAEILLIKKNTNQLNIDGIDLDKAVKSIQEGDTKVEFAISDRSMSDEQRIDCLINYLQGSDEELIRYRRIAW